jgi:hypothetical protein
MAPAVPLESETTMPYLDLTKEEDVLHLMQLYCAAHPNGLAEGARLRTETRRDGTYVVPPAAPSRLMRWALSRHLVTRKAAARYIEMCATLDKPIPEVLRPVLGLLGDPPREQLVLRVREVFQWLYLHSGEPEPGEGRFDHVFTVQEALAMLDATSAAADEPQLVRERAAELAAWLRDQPPLL